MLSFRTCVNSYFVEDVILIYNVNIPRDQNTMLYRVGDDVDQKAVMS